MRIVNTFISDANTNIPEYSILSLKRARELNPDLEIDFISNKKESFFDKLRINWIPQDSINGDLLKQFNSICDFKRHGTPHTTYPSPSLFWHRTTERIFYLQEYLSQNKFDDIFHFENDVLIYYPLTMADVSDTIRVTDMSQTHTTFAFCHIPKHYLLTALCLYFNKMLSLGEHKLMEFGYGHISEMSLLNMALRSNLVTSFPITINNEGGFIYDPGSYGQYFGGTNNGHGSGFTDPTHYIGSMIRSNKIKPVMENNKPKTESNLIFNLHIHSKNLEKF